MMPPISSMETPAAAARFAVLVRTRVMSSPAPIPAAANDAAAVAASPRPNAVPFTDCVAESMRELTDWTSCPKPRIFAWAWSIALRRPRPLVIAVAASAPTPAIAAPAAEVRAEPIALPAEPAADTILEKALEAVEEIPEKARPAALDAVDHAEETALPAREARPPIPENAVDAPEEIPDHTRPIVELIEEATGVKTVPRPEMVPLIVPTAEAKGAAIRPATPAADAPSSVNRPFHVSTEWRTTSWTRSKALLKGAAIRDAVELIPATAESNPDRIRSAIEVVIFETVSRTLANVEETPDATFAHTFAVACCIRAAMDWTVADA